ncbi:fasciclin domain-containing protein [uncultured Bacteroides sp.]|uniref:fasciclin domain-containing protein n=1 Tax=uncultured Bacteroides sp. TaxID=162156 RepID=UPI002AAC3E22|nr:fasciclin domain-containing protein [uncultured Bacteroides sp.]
MKNIGGLFILLIVSLCSCSDPYANTAYIENMKDVPAATYMTENPETYSLWVDLLKYTDLYNTINLSSNYTCFVPNNDAMNAYLKSKNVSSVKELNKNDAITLVKYHTVKGAQYTSSNFDDGALADTTATGDFLSIKNGGLNAIRVNDEALIVGLDKVVTNGVIQTLDHVLTPITETIWDKMQVPSYSILKSAIEVTGYSEQLKKIMTTETLPDYTVSVRKYKYTLFAVSNDVFAKMNITDLSSLAAYIGATDTNYADPSNALNKYISYHIIDQMLSFNSLAKFDANETSKNLATLAENELINLSVVNNALFLNYNSETVSGVQLKTINSNCKNGVVHEVDNIMPVATPKTTTVQWEFTDYSYLAALYSASYRITTLGTASSNWIDSNANGVECYKWQSVPEDRNGVGYYVTDKGSTVKKLALNSDYLMLQLGMFGWVEMKTPAIIKGKYTLKLNHFNALASAKGSKLSFIIDGQYVGSQVATSGNSNKKDQFLSTTIGQVEFSTTTKHTLKILAGDTDVSFLDCLIFTPIN